MPASLAANYYLFNTHATVQYKMLSFEDVKHVFVVTNQLSDEVSVWYMLFSTKKRA